MVRVSADVLIFNVIGNDIIRTVRDLRKIFRIGRLSHVHVWLIFIIFFQFIIFQKDITGFFSDGSRYLAVLLLNDIIVAVKMPGKDACMDHIQQRKHICRAFYRISDGIITERSNK